LSVNLGLDGESIESQIHCPQNYPFRSSVPLPREGLWQLRGSQWAQTLVQDGTLKFSDHEGAARVLQPRHIEKYTHQGKNKYVCFF
jgi:hypothetical protein